MRKKIVLVVIVLVCGVVIYRYLWWGGESETASVPLSGNIELTQVEVAFKVPGKIVELGPDEGDSVNEGQLLARLDPEQLLKARERAEARTESLLSKVRELEALVRYQRETRDAQITQRKAEVRQAQAVLDDLLSGAREQEIEEGRAATARAEAAFDRAQRDWQRAQQLYQNEDISTSQYDGFRAAFEESEAAVAQARQRLALLEEGARKEQIEAARAVVARAEGGVRQAEALDLDIRRNLQSAETLQAEIKAARAETSILESQLKDLEAVSPITGTVFVRSAEVGEVVAAGTAVYSLGDLTRPWIRAYIPETALGRVRLGDRVLVKTDSFPDKDYWGRLSFIASEAEFTPKQIQTQEERVKLVYRVKVDIQNPNQELKLNMPVEAEILSREDLDSN